MESFRLIPIRGLIVKTPTPTFFNLNFFSCQNIKFYDFKHKYKHIWTGNVIGGDLSLFIFLFFYFIFFIKDKMVNCCFWKLLNTKTDSLHFF